MMRRLHRCLACSCSACGWTCWATNPTWLWMLPLLLGHRGLEGNPWKCPRTRVDATILGHLSTFLLRLIRPVIARSWDTLKRLQTPVWYRYSTFVGAAKKVRCFFNAPGQPARPTVGQLHHVKCPTFQVRSAKNPPKTRQNAPETPQNPTKNPRKCILPNFLERTK